MDRLYLSLDLQTNKADKTGNSRARHVTAIIDAANYFAKHCSNNVRKKSVSDRYQPQLLTMPQASMVESGQ